MTQEDDRDLWLYATRGATPLHEVTGEIPDQVRPPIIPLNYQSLLHSINNSPKPLNRRPRSVELDGSTKRRLRQGKIPIEGKLDLHDNTQAQACEALQQFILAAHAQNKRCLLVVTGKGRPNPETLSPNGVIKTRVPEWLKDPELSMAPIFLTAVQAQEKDGGSGALYVYLRRNRDVNGFKHA